MSTPPSVLIVEDEAAMVLAMRVRFRAEGFVVCGTASSKDEAVELARRTAPDFVIMDIRLTGEGDGIDAAREISAAINTAIIFTTGYAEGDVRERATALKPIAFLVKPFAIAELVAVMNRHRRTAP